MLVLDHHDLHTQKRYAVCPHPGQILLVGVVIALAISFAHTRTSTWFHKPEDVEHSVFRPLIQANGFRIYNSANLLRLKWIPDLRLRLELPGCQTP